MEKHKIKKGKITVCIVMAIVCFILAIVMSMQFKVVRESNLTSIDSMREEDLRTELANLKKMYKEAQDQYTEKTAKLEEYKNTEASTEESSNLVKNELSQANMYLGKTDVEGQGIIIDIQDSTAKNGNSQNDENNEEETVSPISSEDILILVDYLKLAGAEAISVNGQRIINTTEIVDIGSSNVIFVNQQRIVAPYEIKAIGDPSKLESTLIGNGGYVEELRNYGFNIDIKKQQKVAIDKYSGDVSHKYIQ